VDDDVLVILKFDFGGDLTVDDFGEECFGHGVNVPTIGRNVKRWGMVWLPARAQHHSILM
jgi:hypothetical protein